MNETYPVADARAAVVQRHWSRRDDNKLHHEYCPGVPAYPCDCAERYVGDVVALDRLEAEAALHEWEGHFHPQCEGCHERKNDAEAIRDAVKRRQENT